MRALLFGLVVSLAALASPSSAQDDALARIRGQSVLGKLDYVRNLEHPPLEILYQRPGKEYGDGFESAMAKEHGPWLRAIADNFDADYAQPNGLRRRLDRPTSTVVVLWMLKDYQPWLKGQTEPNGFSELALYDRALGATVTAEYGVPVQAPHWKRMPMLAQAVRGELDAFSRDGNVRLPHWVAEGLSSYLATHEGVETASLRKHFLDKELVERVVITMHDPGVRNSTLLPLRELFGVTSFPETRAALVKKYGPAVEKLIKPELAMKMVQGQSWALVMYLHEGAGGKYRASFVKYLGSALAGDGSLAAFQKAVPGVDVGALEAEFYAWLFELYGTMFPGRKADPLALKGLGTPAGAPGAKGEAAKPVDLAAALELDVPSAHAGLLFEIRAGRFETAIAELEKLRARPKVGAHAARLETEILRCRKFIALRDKHVGTLAAAGGKLAFEHEGKKQSAKVKGMADGKVFLEENRAKLAALPLEALDPLELAKGFDKALVEGADGWARWYPAVLAGDPKALKGLKAGEGADALRKDAGEFYPQMLANGAAVALLARVAQGAGGDAAAAKAQFEALTELCAKHGETELVTQRKPVLRQAGAAILAGVWEPSKASEATAAKFVALSDGRVRLSYDFQKKEQGDDFSADHGYYASWRATLSGTRAASKPVAQFGDGALRMTGAACDRHPWTIRTPVKIEYDVSFEGLSDDANRTPIFAVAACDDRRESFVWNQGFGSLLANEIAKRFLRSAPVTEGKPIESGTAYSLGLEIVDGKARSLESGAEVKQIEGVPHAGGGVFLFVHSDPLVVFSTLTIEGVPDMDALRDAWVARKLAALGL